MLVSLEPAKNPSQEPITQASCEVALTANTCALGGTSLANCMEWMAKVSSVSSVANSRRCDCDQRERAGADAADLSGVRRLTIHVVNTIDSNGVPTANSPAAINCEEPA